MVESHPIVIRSATLSDAQIMPAIQSYLVREECHVLVASRRDSETPAAFGVLDLVGRVTHPNDPTVALHFAEQPPDFDHLGSPLLLRLIERAEQLGIGRLTAGWDPMDATGLRFWERHGFCPSGAMPYFEQGPGTVQYVSGYQDATGSTLDLIANLR